MPGRTVHASVIVIAALASIWAAPTPQSPLRAGASAPVAGYRVVHTNGIAYDAAHDRLFVTGKLWPTLFEIKIVPRP